MHPSFEERFDEVGELLQRTKAAHSGLYSRIDRRAPAKPVRYQVTGGSFGMYQIKDRTTGKTRAFRDDYKAAHELAMQFEAKTNRQIAVTL
ncbi:hypothetical protein PSJE_01370 [Pseudomonas jessenii]|uniref:Uncharacterized protein n=1 Tax=Pseudomonas jessenii TaxID=77298 RepID=A0A231GQY5_PSEJE|nr:hypothetical protein [Pseudomonas jessenii]OXR38891.1 hypothetical protein PSJE_01370 [Pseudomonas jessenii]SEC42819.1 hypothetical protein SAMN04490187_4329 [Pseudomonas jessenii]